MALPLLTLGRAALGVVGRTAARGSLTARGAAAGGVAGSTAAIGFTDVMKTAGKQSPASNVINFKTANSTIGKSKGGAAAPISSPSVNPTAPMSNDIQAATELSMEELANQTKVLRTIEKNTNKTAKNTTVPPSAGGQAPPPPSEDEIKGDEGKDDAKLAKLLGKLEKGLASSLGTSIIALGAALAVTRDGEDDGKSQTQAEKKLLAATGQSDKIETNILGGKGTSKQIADFSIASTRFTTDEKGNRIVGAAEQEANKAKQEQIAGMIDAAGGSDQDYQLLETAFREGNVQDIQAIEDKYRKVGQEGSAAYQYRAAAESFSQADAVSVARDMGLEKPDLIGADQETKDKFIADMLAKQQEFMEQYSKGIAGEGKNLDRRATLTGDKLFGSSRLDQVVESKFDDEGRGSFFGRSREEGEAFDNIKAELEGYRKSLKSSGVGELEANNKVADEIRNLQGMTADQMLEYTAPKVSGAKLEDAQTSANEAADMKAARQSAAAPTQQTPAASPAGGEKDTVTTGISVNNKAHDNTGETLTKMQSVSPIFTF